MTWEHEDVMQAEYPHLFENFENLADVVQSCTEDNAKIRGGDCNVPKAEPYCKSCL
jgi:hypothetical protein